MSQFYHLKKNLRHSPSLAFIIFRNFCKLLYPVHIGFHRSFHHFHTLACRLVGKLCRTYLYEKFSLFNNKRIIKTKRLADFKPVFLQCTPERIKVRRFCQVFQGVQKGKICVKWVAAPSKEKVKSVLKTIDMTTLGQ